MPTNKPRIDLRFPSPDAFESVRQRASEAGLSINNYILRELGLELLQHGGAHNKFGRKGKKVENKDEQSTGKKSKDS